MATSLNSLPREMLIEIWSWLDFESQKTCARVSKDWKNYIRDSTRLSSELGLEVSPSPWLRLIKTKDLSVEDINAVLSSWPKLKRLHVSPYLHTRVHRGTLSYEQCVQSMSRPGINLKAHPCLEKIISPWYYCSTLANLEYFSDQLEDLIVQGEKAYRKFALKFWLDPKNIMNPVKIENVLGISVQPSNEEVDGFFKKISPMTNLETLTINASLLNKPWNFDWLLSFENLKKLTVIDAGSGSGSGYLGRMGPLGIDWSKMFDAVKKMNRMKTIEFVSCFLTKELVEKFGKQFPPGQSSLIINSCYFDFQITSLLDFLNSLGEMRNKKILRINQWNYTRIRLDNNLDKENTEQIFKKAQEIIDEKLNGLIFITEKKYGSTGYKYSTG